MQRVHDAGVVLLKSCTLAGHVEEIRRVSESDLEMGKGRQTDQNKGG